jgi:flagellar biosynthetic protein FliR
MEAYANELIAVLLISLRITPTLAFAPPFTLIKSPPLVRVILGISLAFWTALSSRAAIPHFDDAQLVLAMCAELMLGVTLALALQLAFAALLTVGRTIDFQIGFGLAVLADPTLRTQMPLVGSLFAYAAAAVFFATSGPADLIALWASSLEQIPLGGFVIGQATIMVLAAYIGTALGIALGIGGVVIVSIFLLDIAIALMSRTLPQMNVLLLGFQVKTLALLVTLPFVFAFSGAGFLRLVRTAIDTTARLI